MKISFAHIGAATLAMERLLKDLGHEVIAPLQPTARTFSLGAIHSPEFACIPFKILMGTYLESMERGADALLSAGGRGPCRAGYYGEIHVRILRELGYAPQMFFIWPPYKVPLDTYKKLNKLRGRTSWIQLAQVIKKAWKMVMAIDDLELFSHRVRPLEREKGSTTKAFNKALGYIKEARTEQEIAEARDAGMLTLKKVPTVSERNILRVGIVGEIYVQIEPTANFFLEETLGEMGVECHRSIFLTNFVRHDVFSRHGDLNAKELAKPYLPEKIGGHGQNSIGDVVKFAAHGFDGVIQLAPFTCIPEIVAKSMMPHLSRELNIPVLTLFIDEQTGRGGIETRLEAFVDLMRQKRVREEVNSDNETFAQVASASTFSFPQKQKKYRDILVGKAE